MSTPSKKKNQKSNTLAVLSLINGADDLFTDTLSIGDFRIFQELEASGYIVGQIGHDTHDAPRTMVEDVGFTTEGRLLMERLIQEKKEAGFLATTWRWLGPCVGWLFGIVATVAGAYLIKSLDL